MRSDHTNKPKNEQRVELKYCEGCGGLGIRECGGVQVYCNACTRKMADLAVSRTPSRQPILPVGRRSILDDPANSGDEDANDLDAMASPTTTILIHLSAAGGAL